MKLVQLSEDQFYMFMSGFVKKIVFFFIIGIKFVPLLRGNVQTSKGLAVLIEQLRIHGLTAEE